jgi:predicted metal-binding membrane protein
MDRVPKAIVVLLIATSALAWIASINQPDMMVAMTTYNPLSISLFTASWTAGMAAMMFPAITPMILMYDRLVTNMKNSRDNQSSVIIQEEERRKATSSFPSLRVIIFVGCYLLVWAVTGISLLLGWSLVMNSTIMTTGNSLLIQYLYGSLLVMAGAYQFTPLKRICIGYCESPMSFFMRRWRDGASGAVNMGVYHGMYCLGCCWAYFLLMVALGWMNLLWMGLFAGIIFGEKMWSRGIWVARAAGIALTITGVLVAGNDMTIMIMNDTANKNTNGVTMSDLSPEASMSMPGDGVDSRGANNESDRMASDYNDQTADPTHNDNNSNRHSKMDMK